MLVMSRYMSSREASYEEEDIVAAVAVLGV